ARVLGPLPLLVGQVMNRRMRRPAWLVWFAYLGAALVVTGPWYLAMAGRDPGFLLDFLWTHNIRRYVAPLDHQQPWWYFLPGLFLGILPWPLLMPGLAKALGRRNCRGGTRHSPMVFLYPFAVCLVFFSLSGCKRMGYLLPGLPPLALLLGWYWALEKKRRH